MLRPLLRFVHISGMAGGSQLAEHRSHQGREIDIGERDPVRVFDDEGIGGLAGAYR